MNIIFKLYECKKSSGQANHNEVLISPHITFLNDYNPGRVFRPSKR